MYEHMVYVYIYGGAVSARTSYIFHNFALICAANTNCVDIFKTNSRFPETPLKQL